MQGISLGIFLFDDLGNVGIETRVALLIWPLALHQPAVLGRTQCLIAGDARLGPPLRAIILPEAILLEVLGVEILDMGLVHLVLP